MLSIGNGISRWLTNGRSCLRWLVLLVGVVATYSAGFLTVRNRNHSWDDIALAEPPPTSERRSSDLSYIDVESRYKLRFRPLSAKPRLFWHKFPLQQTEPGSPEQTETPIATTTTVGPEGMAPLPTEAPLPTALPSTETPAVPETPTDPTNVMTTETAHTRPQSSLRPATTMLTIMRPPFTPQIGSTLKKLLLFFGSPSQANLLQRNPHAPAPKGKGKGFLSLFEVIKFPNTQCFISMGDVRTMEGVCYHEFECKSLGGIPTERCADGVGVCCVFLTGCGDATNQVVSYFESPNYPNAVREVMICVLIVNLRDKVQQLRLDFLMFELNRPTDGDCVDDQFIVSGQNLNFNIPVLCGINTSQHLYVHVGNSFERKIYLSFFAKVASGGRSFNIKVTQLENDLAPDGCLQFYTETEGVLKSFNYDSDGTIVDNREATYLNNLNYVICMERAKETCAVRYVTEQLGSDLLDFQIINKDEAGNDLVPEGQAGAGIFNCPDDFIAINQVRLCAERLNDGTEIDDFTENAPIRDVSAGPIILPFRSDGEYVGRGFRLAYKQEPCI